MGSNFRMDCDHEDAARRTDIYDSRLFSRIRMDDATNSYCTILYDLKCIMIVYEYNQDQHL